MKLGLWYKNGVKSADVFVPLKLHKIHDRVIEKLVLQLEWGHPESIQIITPTGFI